MKRTQIILILIFGALAIWAEFRNIVEDAMLSVSMFYGVPLIILCCLTCIYLFKNTILFKQTKRYTSFVPVLIGFIIIAAIFRHKQWRSSIDDSPILISAINYDIGSDGGFILDFKANNHLKAEKRDHWIVTYYWGTYERTNDSLLLNIPLDFKMGRHAVLQKDTLSFTDDTLYFEVIYPPLLKH